MEIKVNIGDPKSGRTFQRTISEDDSKTFFGKRIGDTIKGELINAAGYEFKIMGGSDYCGFPMRRDVDGTLRKRILLASGIGLRTQRQGCRVRKTVAANTVFARTAQLNVRVTKHGQELLGPAPAEQAE